MEEFYGLVESAIDAAFEKNMFLFKPYNYLTHSKIKRKEIQEFISKMTKIFSDRFYFEIQRHNDPGEKYLENNLLSLSKKFKVPLIASQEIFYINKVVF